MLYVHFRPYTLKQYKMIKPKEYVEIGNIKPGKRYFYIYLPYDLI